MQHILSDEHNFRFLKINLLFHCKVNLFLETMNIRQLTALQKTSNKHMQFKNMICWQLKA